MILARSRINTFFVMYKKKLKKTEEVLEKKYFDGLIPTSLSYPVFLPLFCYDSHYYYWFYPSLIMHLPFFFSYYYFTLKSLTLNTHTHALFRQLQNITLSHLSHTLLLPPQLKKINQKEA